METTCLHCSTAPKLLHVLCTTTQYKAWLTRQVCPSRSSHHPMQIQLLDSQSPFTRLLAVCGISWMPDQSGASLSLGSKHGTAVPIQLKGGASMEHSVKNNILDSIRQ